MSLAQLSKAVLRSPAQVAASLSPLIGFTPTESIVVIMTKSGIVEVTMRIDLPEDWSDAADHIATTAQWIGVDGAVIAVCTDSATAWDDITADIHHVIARLGDVGIKASDAILVQDNRYWSLLHDDEGAQGAVWFPEDSPLPQPAEVTREEVSSRYLPRPDLAPSEAAYAAAQRHLRGSRREQAQRALEALTRLSEASSDQPCHGSDFLRAIVQIAVQDFAARDWLLGTVVTAKNHRELVQSLTDSALAAAPRLRARACGAAAAALAATTASTVPASCMATLAEDDSLGELVNRAISSGIHPDEIRETFISALPKATIQIESEDDLHDGDQKKSIRSCDKPVRNLS